MGGRVTHTTLSGFRFGYELKGGDVVVSFDTCIHQIFPLDMQGPAEYCQEDAVDGYYCAAHNPDNVEPDWDDIRKDRLVGNYDCE